MVSPLGFVLRRGTRGRATPTTAGARTGAAVVDLLAPDAITIGRDHLHLDALWTCTLALTAYPRTVSWGWLSRITALREPLTMSVHVRPQDSASVIRQYTQHLTMLHSSRLFAAEKGRLASAERTQAISDTTALLERLERGDERLFLTSVYARVHGADPSDLEERTRRVEGAFGQSLMQTRRALFEPLAGLESTLPTGRDALAVSRPLDGAALATMYPFGAPTLRMPEGIWYGRNLQNNTLVVVDPFHRGFTNYNSCIIAASGAGKSVAAKVEILRGLALGLRFVVIDPGESGEYVRLAQAVGGQVVRLSAGSRDRINPLDLPRVTGDEEYDVLGEHVRSVQRLLDLLVAGEGVRVGPAEASRLETALFACYQRAGITRDRSTHTKPAPTLPDLSAVLVESGDPFGLAERLVRYCTGALSGLFSGRTTVSLDADLTVFDLRGLEDDDLRAAMMHVVTQHTWSSVLGAPHPRRLIVDEAHLICKRAAAGQFLEALAKRARKHWLGVTAITQDPVDFLETAAGRALLINSSMALLLRNEELALEALGRWMTLSPAERTYLQGCPVGRGLLLVQHPYAGGERMRVQVEVMVSPEQQPLVFTRPYAADAGDEQAVRRQAAAR
jgi:type IV secretory pathway VirB4 component